MYRLSRLDNEYVESKSSIHQMNIEYRATDRIPVADLFRHRWDFVGGPAPSVENIYRVDDRELRLTHRGQRFDAYRRRRDGRWRYGFHGSSRFCQVGVGPGGGRIPRLALCNQRDCGTCGIVKSSFKVRLAGKTPFLIILISADGKHIQQPECLDEEYIQQHHLSVSDTMEGKMVTDSFR